MIPKTYPSTPVVGYESAVIAVVSPTGEKWTDYIPVKFIETIADSKINTYDLDGAIAADQLSSVSGKQAYTDYVPVVEVTDPDSGKWRTDGNGFIPLKILRGPDSDGILLETLNNFYILLEDSTSPNRIKLEEAIAP